MKKNLAGLLTFCLMIFSFAIVAQSVKEGKVIYKIKYTDETLDPKALKSMPGTLTLTFKGGNSRVDYGSDFKIMNPSLKKMFYCTGSKGKKNYQVWNLDDESIRTNREIRESKNTGESKSVAGVNCMKFFLGYYLTDKDATWEAEVWSAPMIQPVAMPEFVFDGAKGLPMIFETAFNGIAMHLEATALDKTPVNDSKFILPAGYTKSTPVPSDSLTPPREMKTLEIK